MAGFNGQPVVLGGLLYQAGDTATVETFNGSRWSALPSMPTEKRVFDAIGLGDRLCTFGGYVASSGLATDEITCFDGTSWSNGKFPSKNLPKKSFFKKKYLRKKNCFENCIFQLEIFLPLDTERA
jgi:hypothetical protein